MKEVLRYDKMVETALRGVVREALARAAADGLPGAHHFYITLRTRFPGVVLPDYLRKQYPDEMTIVLEVEDDHFAVTLSFKNRTERLTIPFTAVTSFADPSVKFGLQFQTAGADDSAPLAEPDAPAPEPAKQGAVVALDAFRKK